MRLVLLFVASVLTRTALFGVLILVTTLVVTSAVKQQADARRDAYMPRCEEDQSLIGTGDFDHGRWTSYTCGPSVDDWLDLVPAPSGGDINVPLLPTLCEQRPADWVTPCD